jgi:Protein CHAPERONE-LIKE PROTEIN OF POR1-like
MSEPTPYEQLGVSDNASFEEIRDARDRLQKECESDEQQQAVIESAYDAILMDRLKARQEGKIKVPEGIRFPERAPNPVPQPSLPRLASNAPAWLTNFLDNPNPREIWISFGAAATLIFLAIIAPNAAASAWLPLGLLGSVYWIGRKESKFGRGFLIVLAGFIVAVLIGIGVGNLPVAVEYGGRITSTLIIFVMWLVACFLR